MSTPKGKGRDGKGKDSHMYTCPTCWRRINNNEAAIAQHQWFSRDCLTWRYYLGGGRTWSERVHLADRVKEVREQAEYPFDTKGVERSRSVAPEPDTCAPKASSHKENKWHRHERRHKKEATEAALLALEVHGRNRKQKQAKTGRKEEKKADKAKKRRARTPSPDVRRKHHRRDPPSSEDEEGRPRPHVQMVADGTFLVKLH